MYVARAICDTVHAVTQGNVLYVCELICCQVTRSPGKRSACAATEVYHDGVQTVMHGITADGEYCEALIGDGVVHCPWS